VSKLDKLKAKIDFLRDKIKYIVALLLGGITAFVTLMIGILAGEKPVYLIIFTVLLIIFIGYLSSLIMVLNNKIESLIDQLEEEHD
jgi:hypothetical protein